MNVFGNTGDKDTDNSASARGGNDLDKGVDEAGWKKVGGVIIRKLQMW